MTLEKEPFLPINPGRVKGHFQTLRSPSFYREKDCETKSFLLRERPADTEDDSLAGSPLQPKRSSLTPSEKQEDADNQKNSTRASQAGLNSNAIHVPVTITAPPGETTIIPS